ncbi:MAG: DUF4922 domain-containing protein, partial [Ignavibacteria bacterium]|nr:DUF4922 domain-containing protein [Ignavibacteria bacterium]
ATLDSVQVKTFQFENCSIKVQFNPGRLISTSAKVDTKSINERKCFLCKANLPEAQQVVEYKDDFIILVNPFPIFPEHLTLPSLHHTKQNIESSFPVLLDFSKDLSPDFSVFYNGPKCGASAPDHLHFQAGTKNFMTIDHEYELLREKIGEKLLESVSLSVYSLDDNLRKMISIEGGTKSEVEKAFQVFYSSYKDVTEQTEEPMMNIIGTYQKGKWQIIIFLRKKHRPDLFFEEDEAKKILLSPAAVDIGGVCILPREEDFEKLTTEKLHDIFSEVFIDVSLFRKFKIKLKNDLGNIFSLDS